MDRILQAVTFTFKIPTTSRVAIPRTFTGRRGVAHGSRLTHLCHDGSDFDLVLRGPGLQVMPIEKLLDFRHALQESLIPFLAAAHDWSHLPERFHKEIERDYVRLV